MKFSLKKFFTILFLTLILIISSPLVYSQDSPQNTEEKEEVQTEVSGKVSEFPVILDGQNLFFVKEEFGPVSAEDRAKKISNRLKNIAENLVIDPESIDSLSQDNLTFIFSGKLSGENTILTITEADAKAFNSSRQELAELYINQIKNGITKYREERQDTNIVRGLLFSAICTIAFLIILFLINLIIGKIYSDLNSLNKSFKGLKIRGFELISAERLKKNLLFLVVNLRWIINLTITTIYLGIISSFFPTTKRISLQFWNYLVNAVKLIAGQIISYLPNLLIIGIIVLLTYYVISLVKPIFSELEKGTITLAGFYPEWAEPTYRILEVLILAIAGIMIFPYLPGFGSAAFQNISILLGVLVSLGSTAAVSNVVAGIILIYTRAFQLGDRVRFGDVLGNVEEKSLIVTRVRTFENIIITIPNSSLLSGNIINYSASIRDTRTPVMLTAVVTLGYDVPWKLIYETLIRAALDTTYILEDPLPLVLQTSLGDFSVTYELKAYTNSPTQMEVIYSELHQNMQDKCNEADIEILSPIYSAVRDGNTSTIPENYLDKDYEAPGFLLNPLGNLFQIDLNLTPNQNKKSN